MLLALVTQFVPVSPKMAAPIVNVLPRSAQKSWRAPLPPPLLLVVPAPLPVLVVAPLPPAPVVPAPLPAPSSGVAASSEHPQSPTPTAKLVVAKVSCIQRRACMVGSYTGCLSRRDQQPHLGDGAHCIGVVYVCQDWGLSNVATRREIMNGLPTMPAG